MQYCRRQGARHRAPPQRGGGGQDPRPFGLTGLRAAVLSALQGNGHTTDPSPEKRTEVITLGAEDLPLLPFANHSLKLWHGRNAEKWQRREVRGKTRR